MAEHFLIWRELSSDHIFQDLCCAAFQKMWQKLPRPALPSTSHLRINNEMRRFKGSQCLLYLIYKGHNDHIERYFLCSWDSCGLGHPHKVLFLRDLANKTATIQNPPSAGRYCCPAHKPPVRGHGSFTIFFLQQITLVSTHLGTSGAIQETLPALWHTNVFYIRYFP